MNNIIQLNVGLRPLVPSNSGPLGFDDKLPLRVLGHTGTGLCLLRKRQDLTLVPHGGGGGEDHIIDTIGDPIVGRQSQIKLGLGSLKLDLGNGGAIHIDNFDPNDVVGSSSIQQFQFANGTVLTTEELVARGFDLDGTSGDDTISGTNVTDRITGSAGNDLLEGGKGSDTYFYNLGDGTDTISDNSQWLRADGSIANDLNVLRLGAGITDAGVTPRYDSASGRVLLDFGNGDTLDIGAPGSLAIQAIRFDGGSAQAISEFIAQHGGLGTGDISMEGTPGPDVLTGTQGAERIRGYADNDILNGNGGDDTLEGGTSKAANDCEWRKAA